MITFVSLIQWTFLSLHNHSTIITTPLVSPNMQLVFKLPLFSKNKSLLAIDLFLRRGQCFQLELRAMSINSLSLNGPPPSLSLHMHNGNYKNKNQTTCLSTVSSLHLANVFLWCLSLSLHNSFCPLQ